MFAGSLFVTGDTPGFGVRAELPDDRGATSLRAEYRRPNWDFVQSLVGDGTRDRLAVGRRQRFTGDLTGRLDIGANRYGIEGDRDAASTFAVGGELRLGNLASIRGLSTAYVFDGEYVLRRDERIGADGTDASRPCRSSTGRSTPRRSATPAHGEPARRKGFSPTRSRPATAWTATARRGRSSPACSATLSATSRSGLRGGYVQNIGRARSTNTVLGGSLTWIF